MAGPRQPIQLVIANGKKHLTKAEIEERTAREVQPCTEEIAAPSYLLKKQKDQFNRLARQLQKIQIMGETDVDALARYVTAQSQYETATKELRQLVKERPKKDDEKFNGDRELYYKAVEWWADAQDTLAKLQNRYFTQAHTAASSLGLTISSRCKLEVPVQEEAPKVNKFSKFGKAAESE